jgi:hypothetical protein
LEAAKREHQGNIDIRDIDVVNPSTIAGLVLQGTGKVIKQ